jgi:hypothetical protein
MGPDQDPGDVKRVTGRVCLRNKINFPTRLSTLDTCYQQTCQQTHDRYRSNLVHAARTQEICVQRGQNARKVLCVVRHIDSPPSHWAMHCCRLRENGRGVDSRAKRRASAKKSREAKGSSLNIRMVDSSSCIRRRPLAAHTLCAPAHTVHDARERVWALPPRPEGLGDAAAAAPLSMYWNVEVARKLSGDDVPQRSVHIAAPPLARTGQHIRGQRRRVPFGVLAQKRLLRLGLDAPREDGDAERHVLENATGRSLAVGARPPV